MDQKVEDWLRIRLAAIDTFERRMLGPFFWLPTAIACAVSIYIMGFLRFNLMSFGSAEFRTIETVQVFLTLSAALLVALMAPALAVTMFIERRLRHSRNVLLADLNKVGFAEA
ncbi:MAG: hypothetical protein R3D84_00970 [Paracoccaceae bacterium]